VALVYTLNRPGPIDGTTRAVGYTLIGSDITFLGRALPALIQAGHVIVTHGDVTEVQTLTWGGTVNAGSYTITFDGETTGAIDHDATAATITTALEALGKVGVGDITVTGGGAGHANITLTFVNRGNVPQVTIGNSLGGTAPTLTPSTTTAPVVDRNPMAQLGVRDTPVNTDLLTTMMSRG
jgi:hypothetical protein